MCSHVCLQLAPKLRQTCELIVCSVWIRFIAYRWQSLLINREVAVGHIYSKTWPDTLRAHCPKRAETFCCLHVLVSAQHSAICWAQKQLQKKKEKKNDCNLCGGRNAGPLSHFSWSNLEPLFRKQKRAGWLTARDNVKGMKTYTVTLAFLLSAHSVALWVTSCPQQQITGFQSVKPTLTDCKCVRYIDQAPHPQYANTRSLIYSSCRHLSANILNANLWFTGSRETYWCDRNIWYLAKVHKPQIRRNV